MAAMKKLLVFGGTGFVGSHVVQRALLRGYKVVVASRGGLPPAQSPLGQLAQRVRLIGGCAAARESLAGTQASSSSPPQSSSKAGADGNSDAIVKQQEKDNHEDNENVAEELRALEFVSLDATVRSQVFDFLHDQPDASAIVSTVGCLTRDYERARAVNGDANVNIAAGVYHVKLVPAVQKFVYISVEPYDIHLPWLFYRRATLKGYFQGKRAAERAVLDNLGMRAVVLRPGMIYGTRPLTVTAANYFTGSERNSVEATFGLPLGLLGYPLDKLLTTLRGRRLLTPPVSVEVVAEAAVRACSWTAPTLSALRKNSSSNDSDSKGGGGGVHEVTGVVDVAGMHAICRLSDPTLNVSPPGRLTCSKPCTLLHMSALDCPLRRLSVQSTHWFSQQRYGADMAPLFGSWANAFNEEALVTRQLYCRALVYASGGGRRARDWIAGCTALLMSNEALLHTALQYNASERDLLRLREHLLDQLLARHDKHDSSSFAVVRRSTDETNTTTKSDAADVAQNTATSASSSSTTTTTITTQGNYTCEEMRCMANSMLQQSAELRCFMSDAMTASLFHIKADPASIEEVRRRVFYLGAHYFGYDEATLEAMWDVALTELQLRKDKICTLGQQLTE